MNLTALLALVEKRHRQIALKLEFIRSLVFGNEFRSMSISKPLLVILIFWMVINFISFGLFAPRNATVIVTLCLCAIAVAGAIFLILEFYRPFGGFIQIPSTTMHNALAQMGH